MTTPIGSMPPDPFGPSSPSAEQIFTSVGRLRFPTNFHVPDVFTQELLGLQNMFTMFVQYPEIGIGGRSFNQQAQIIANDVDKLGIDIRSFRVPLRRSVEEVLIPRIRNNFAIGGDPRWQPLAQGTVDNRKGSAEPVLIRTGRLRRVATQKNMWYYHTVTPFSGGEINGVEFDQRQLEKRALYGVFHQYGSTHGERVSRAVALNPTNAIFESVKLGGRRNWELPARMFVTMTGADQIEIETIFYHWLSERADWYFYKMGSKPGRI